MPRIDDYLQAFHLAKSSLEGVDPDLLADRARVRIEREETGRTSLQIPFLSELVLLGWPQFGFRFDSSDREVLVQQQILILHYLLGVWNSGDLRVAGEWIAFQDIPDGRFYLDSFQRRAKIPLVRAFGEKPEKLIETAGAAYGAKPIRQGDFSVVIEVFPLVPVALVLWKGDEEFPPEGNILFDRSIARIFSAEDVAWLAGMVVYPLAAMNK
jgi:hypothetical protein